MSTLVNLHRIAPRGETCTTCGRSANCAFSQATGGHAQGLEAVVTGSRPLARGQTLFRAGDASAGLYVIKTGAFKLVQPDIDGNDHVVQFNMAGDLLGLDALPNGRHSTSAIALDTSAACLLPWRAFEQTIAACPALARVLLQAAGHEIHAEQRRTTLVGHTRARERLLGFLHDLSRRYAERGYSGTEIHLPMPRYDVGDYLGLATETVSRLFTVLEAEGEITVERRLIRLHRPPVQPQPEPARLSA